MIFIPFDTYKNIGGPTTFMANLRSYLDSISYGYQLSSDSNTKTIFFPISYHVKELEELKSNGVKIVQRLDGLFYPEKHGEDYNKDYMSQIKHIYTDLADMIVFQSDYSKKQCFALLGEKKEGQYVTIINGAYNDKYYPRQGDGEVPKHFNFVTTGNFRNIDMLEPVVKAFDSLIEEGINNFALNVVGPITNETLRPLLDRDYIKHIDGVPNSEIPHILRDNHIFIYSHLNPPCPNSVIEAISTGMPVVGFDSGAMKELVYFSTDLLAEVNDKVFQRYKDFDPHKLSEKIKSSMNKYDHYKKLALSHINEYDFSKAGNEYVKLFKQL